MSVNTINWDEISIGGTVTLSEAEFRAFAAYRYLRTLISSSLSAIRATLKIVFDRFLERYLELRFGTRLNLLGEVVANIEYYLDECDAKIKVRRFTGHDGAFQCIKGKLVKVRSSGRFSQWSEGSVENARKIAMELIDNDLEKKIDKRVENTKRFEMANAKRTYGFNDQFYSGLNHERGN